MSVAAVGARRLLWLGVIWGVPIVFILVPMTTFLAYSFWLKVGNEFVPAFSLANYVEWASDPTYPAVFWGTVQLAVMVMLLDLLLGYPVAYFIWRCRAGRWRFLLLLLTVIPLLMSYIIKLYAMRSILGLNGFLNQLLVWLTVLEQPTRLLLYNQFAVLLTMTVVYLPFVIVPIYVTLERIGRGLVDASADLGGRPFHTFRYVVLPLSAPGAVVGAVFALILALGDFVTPQMVGGTQGFTYGKVVWSQFGMGYNWPFGAAMGMVLLVVSLAAIAAAGWLAARGRRAA